MALNESKGNQRIILCSMCGVPVIATNGRQKYCIDCKRIATNRRALKYRENNRGEIRKRSLEHYHSNKEKYSESNKKYSNTPKKKYYIYKNSAKHKGLAFNLSFNDFMLYWNKACFYCGNSIATIGIDRVNNDIGYIKDNIVPCCTDCNSMKSNKSVSHFISLCCKISDHQKGI